MLRTLRLSDHTAILNAGEVADTLQESQREARDDALRAAVRGAVDGVHDDQGGDWIDPDSRMASSQVTRTSLSYVDLTGGGHTYRVFRNGRIDPQSGAPSLAEAPVVAAYLQNHRWPYTSGSGVTVSAEATTAVNTSVDYRVTTTATQTFDLDTPAIRSDDTLRVVLAATGSGTCVATLQETVDGSPTPIATGSKSVSSGSWDTYAITITPPGRIGRNRGPLSLSIDAAGLTWAQPVLYPARDTITPSLFPLSDGTAFLYVEPGHGWMTDGTPWSLSAPVSFRFDLAGGPIMAYGVQWPTGSKTRAVVTGRDRSGRHDIEWTFSARLWASPSLPNRPHLPIARFSPS